MQRHVDARGLARQLLQAPLEVLRLRLGACVDKLEAVPALHSVAGVLSVQVQAIAISQVTSAIVGPVQRGI